MKIRTVMIWDSIRKNHQLNGVGIDDYEVG
jgi:hypothetical protein